jgi:PAS domain-containing protein
VISRAKALSVELDTAITPGLRRWSSRRRAESKTLRADLRPEGWNAFPGRRVGDGAARHAGRDYRISAHWHRQHRPQAREAELVKAGALQNAIFNSANFSSIATDAKGVIQIFNVGAERMLGYAASEVVNKITPADISDPQEVIGRAKP